MWFGALDGHHRYLDGRVGGQEKGDAAQRPQPDDSPQES
jgi:hypothetical protein